MTFSFKKKMVCKNARFVQICGIVNLSNSCYSRSSIMGMTRSRKSSRKSKKNPSPRLLGSGYCEDLLVKCPDNQITWNFFINPDIARITVIEVPIFLGYKAKKFWNFLKNCAVQIRTVQIHIIQGIAVSI